MYDKAFDSWNTLKSKLHHSEKKILFQESEIWVLHLGSNIGIEQDGKGDSFVRPVLVLRKFNNRHFLGVPLTTREKPENIGFLLKDISFLKNKSWLILSQVRVFDSKRLHRKMGKISDKIFSDINKKSAQVFTRASGA